MKKILSVTAGSLLFLSVTVFAEEHLNAALEHVIFTIIKFILQGIN